MILLCFSFTGNYAEAILINPSIQVIANYEINGKILNTPIFGNGNANITLGNWISYNFLTYWIILHHSIILDKGVYRYEVLLPKEIRDGDTYFKLTRPRAAYETVQSFYQLDNLYNGDPYLGMNFNTIYLIDSLI